MNFGLFGSLDLSIHLNVPTLVWILKNDGAEIVESKDWSKRRFAYEIGGFTEGVYHIVNIKAENADAINEFDRLSKINDGILRHMIVKRED